MLGKSLNAVVASTLSLCLSGCNSHDQKSEIPPAPRPAASAPIQAASAPVLIVELDSPDRALKTWWRYIDLRVAAVHDRCIKSRGAGSDPEAVYLSKISQGEVLEGMTPDTASSCRLETFSRDIQEIKQETETRAVAFALVKNTTPIPAGADPSTYEKKERNEGFKYRYVIEKTSEGWKVAQLFRYDDTNVILKRDPWVNIHKRSAAPYYPSGVYLQ